MNEDELRKIFFEFKQKYPHIQGLNLTQQKKILDGELVIVKVSGTNKFTLMTKEDVQPGGKLDQRNQEIREMNQKIREMNREVRRGFRDALGSAPQDLIDLVLSTFNKKGE